MKLIPKNNWISVDLLEDIEEETSSSVLLPDDYLPQESPYKVVLILMDAHPYCAGTSVVVPTHVIREVQVKNEKFYLVEKNHIMAECQ